MGVLSHNLFIMLIYDMHCQSRGLPPKCPKNRAPCLAMQPRVMEGRCSGQSRPCKRKPAPFTRGAGFEEKGVLTQEKEERGRCLFLERLPAQPGKSVATPP